MNPNWYYAKDGQPVGPVDLATITQLYHEGKIAPDGLVWQDGTPDWVMASSVLDSSAGASLSGAPRILDGGSGQIDFEACFSESWAVFKAHWPLMLAAGAIFIFISLLIRGPVEVLHFVMRRQIEANPFVLIELFWMSILLNVIFAAPLMVGFFQFCLQSLRDKPRLEILFLGFKEYWLQSSLCMLVMVILIILGFICLIIPGIYLSVVYYFALPLVIDRRMGFWEAMELSRKTVHKQWFMVFAVVIVGGILSIAGALLCCVGVIGSLPLGYLFIMQAYRQLFAATPPTGS